MQSKQSKNQIILSFWVGLFFGDVEKPIEKPFSFSWTLVYWFEVRATDPHSSTKAVDVRKLRISRSQLTFDPENKLEKIERNGLPFFQFGLFLELPNGLIFLEYYIYGLACYLFIRFSLFDKFTLRPITLVSF